MLFVLLLILTAPPRVSQHTQDVRTSSGLWLAGDGFTGAEFLYDGTTTVKYNDKGNALNIEDEFRAAIAGPPAFDVARAGKAPITVYSDTEAFAQPSIDQGKSAPGYAQSYCTAFVVRGKDGLSRTYCLNVPKAFGIAGSDPRSLPTMAILPITGRHLASTRTKPTVWLVDDNQAIRRCVVCSPGGRGTGNVVDIARSTLWFTIPSEVPPGDYQLYVFTGENRWGISNPIPVTVIGPRPPPNVVSVQVASGTDVTSILSSVKSGTVCQLPSGLVTLSKTIDVGGNVSIIGSSKDTTVVRSSRDLVADPNKLTLSRDSMIRLTGSNITFKDLTIELTPGTTRSAIAAGPGIDSVSFENCRFISTTPLATDNGYCYGFFFRHGLHRYWRLENCDFECNQPFEATNGANNGFRNNGAFDYGLINNCRFRSVHGLLSGSLLGSCFGRGTMVYGLDVSYARRGLALSSGDGSLESVVANCSFHDMLSERGNGESILFESRGGFVSPVTPLTSPMLAPVLPHVVYIQGDKQDRTRWTVAVIDGTGKGQYRVVKSSVVSSSGGLHVLESPWEIPPDSTSRVIFSQAPTDCSFTFNRFSDTAGGINLYGNAFGISLTSNWLRNSPEGVMLNTSWDDTHKSVSMWHSLRSNIFEDSVGHHLIAPRVGTDTHPQIAFVNIFESMYVGNVSNHLWAASGTEYGNDENAATANLIDFVSDMYPAAYSDRSKYQQNHRVLIPFVARPLWRRTQSGVGRVLIGGATIDDVRVRDGLIETVVR